MGIAQALRLIGFIYLILRRSWLVEMSDLWNLKPGNGQKYKKASSSVISLQKRGDISAGNSENNTSSGNTSARNSGNGESNGSSSAEGGSDRNSLVRQFE